MKSIKTPTLIIKHQDFGEADRLLTLLSYDLGKVRAINRGARKPLSKLAGHLEPFSLTDCQLQEGRTFYTVTSAQLTHSFPTIRSQLSKTSLVSYWLEMVDTLLPDAEPQPTLFVLLQQSLHILESSDLQADDQLLTAGFSLKFLSNIGYLPEMMHCVACHAPLEPTKNRFSARLGGILDDGCWGTDPAALPIAADTIKAMRLLTQQSITIIPRLALVPSVLKELENITELYLHYQVGRPLRSVGFVREALI